MSKRGSKKGGKRQKVTPVMEDRGHLLFEMLAVAVPLWIEKTRGMSFDEALRRAAECQKRLQDAGEAVLYRVKKPGATADGFNAVAEGLAILARFPGGVRFGPLHWDAGKTHPFT